EKTEVPDGFDVGMGQHVSNDEEGGRPAWDNQVQFLLACIAYAVGLGNIWRFPYLAQTYGGGAFLIPYILMLVFEGVPLFLLELAVGQRLRQGSIGAWTKFHPYLGGIGIGSMVVSFMIQVLSNPQVWLDAATQIFFSLGLGFGGVIAFASYNPKKQNCQRDALIIALTNSFTSIFASIVIFAILGYRATLKYEDCLDGNIAVLLDTYEKPDGYITYDNYAEELIKLNGSTNWQGTSITIESLNLSSCDVQTYLAEASQGTGLAFIVFTEAIINMPGSPVWSVLFFMMLLSLGLGSMFGTVEGVVTPLFDLGLKVPKPILTGIICLISCAIGLIFCTRAGNYWVDIFNNYAGSIPLLVIAFFEITVISWAYGLKNNMDIVLLFPFLLVYYLSRYFAGGVWCIPVHHRNWTTQRILFLSTLFKLYKYFQGTQQTELYPWFAVMVIILLIVLPCVGIPIVWISRIIKVNFMNGKEPEGILVDKEKGFKNMCRDLLTWERFGCSIKMCFRYTYMYNMSERFNKIHQQNDSNMFIFSIYTAEHMQNETLACLTTSNQTQEAVFVYAEQILKLVAGLLFGINFTKMYKKGLFNCKGFNLDVINKKTYWCLQVYRFGKKHTNVTEQLRLLNIHYLGLLKKHDAEKEERPQWDNKAQFLLTCIGFAVGLGNVWRFPYQLQSNGGGAFLIPYLIMLVFEGIPLLYLELSVGQLLQSGSVGCWNKLSPYMRGLGICSLFVSFLVGMYYNTIIAWCLWYLCNSFQEPLPWNECPPNANLTAPVQECALSSATEYYWYRKTLNITPSITESGGIQVHILACIILAWLIVVYFTATFPYVVMFCFLVRGLTLPGSSTGLSYLFTPKLEVLSDPQIWLTAATQIFFSLSLAFGGMIAFSSYNPRDSDVEANTYIVAVTNSLTSLLATVVIFSVLGFKATVDFESCVSTNIEILLDYYDQPQGSISIAGYDAFLTEKHGSVLNGTTFHNLTECSVEKNLDEGASGTGLAFIVFAEAILRMPGSPFWSVLFFLMLLTLGLDSMFGNIEGVLTPLNDMGITKKMRNEYVVGIIVIVSFLVSLTFVQGSGNYWLDVFDKYAGSIPLLIIAFFELTTLSWIFGYLKFEKSMVDILPPRSNIFRTASYWYWRVTIPVISPLLLLAVFIYYLYDSIITPLTYKAWQAELIEIYYPDYVVAISVLITLLCTLWIPLGAIYHLIQRYRGKNTLAIDAATPSNGKVNIKTMSSIE
uniref:Transporter n=1 Tax=Ciona savignyi TaxID=51511 RepID=H2YE59_CIOSA